MAGTSVAFGRRVRPARSGVRLPQTRPGSVQRIWRHGVAVRVIGSGKSPRQPLRAAPVVVAALALIALLMPGAPLAKRTLPAANTPEALAPTASLDRLPARFEQNLGQAPEGVAFTAKTRTLLASFNGGGIDFGLAEGVDVEQALGSSFGPDGALSNRRIQVVSMRFVGANPAAVISAEEVQEGVSNYYLGNDPTKWRTNVPGYSRIRFSETWPGIDMVVRDDDGDLRYDFEVAPGADPSLIAFDIEGSESVRIDEDGALEIGTRDGRLTHQRPATFQTVDGRAEEIRSGFVLREPGRVGFVLGDHDPAGALTIDPTVVYSTYRGGAAWDLGRNVAVGYSYGGQSAVVVGATQSANFPVGGAFQGSLAGSFDAFVTKLNPTGTSMQFSTYLGGSGWDGAWDIELGGGGEPYIAGHTESTDFPTSASLPSSPAPIQAANAGSADAFLTQLFWHGGAIFYSSYLGGSSGDGAESVTVDPWSNAIYVAGWTSSTNFPTASPFQASAAGVGDAFVAKTVISGDFTSGFSALLAYSTYLGGSGFDGAKGISLGIGNDIYVVGSTSRQISLPHRRYKHPMQAVLTHLSRRSIQPGQH